MCTTALECVQVLANVMVQVAFYMFYGSQDTIFFDSCISESCFRESNLVKSSNAESNFCKPSISRGDFSSL